MTDGSAIATPAVTRLTLTDFRSYASASLVAAPGPVVLTGPNGAGKTNLLEALSFLAPGRGLRRAALPDIVRRGASDGAGWAVSARLTGADGEIRVGTGLATTTGAAKRRIVRIDGSEAESQARLGDVAAFVWLTPPMDRLFLEGPGGRRRFLDRLVYALQPSHLSTLSAYETAMRERNRLLRDGIGDRAWLDALEARMAADGTAVAACRQDLVNRLSDGIATPTGATPNEGDFPTARIALAGTLEQALATAPALAVEEEFLRTLAHNRGRDAKAGLAVDGPHRSDLAVVHAAKDMPARDCSTGEQKALLIGLVLAHARLLASDKGTAPILLLDEIMAHLDDGRRHALAETLTGIGGQCWLTGTEPGLFQAFGDRALHLAVSNGQVA